MLKIKELKETESKVKKKKISFFQKLFHDPEEVTVIDSQVTEEDMKTIKIGEDFERDGDCGEYSTFITFSEGYLVTVDRVFHHQRKDLRLHPDFMELEALARVSGCKSLK